MEDEGGQGVRTLTVRDGIVPGREQRNGGGVLGGEAGSWGLVRGIEDEDAEGKAGENFLTTEERNGRSQS